MTYIVLVALILINVFIAIISVSLIEEKDKQAKGSLYLDEASKNIKIGWMVLFFVVLHVFRATDNAMQSEEAILLCI